MTYDSFLLENDLIIIERIEFQHHNLFENKAIQLCRKSSQFLWPFVRNELSFNQ